MVTKAKRIPIADKVADRAVLEVQRAVNEVADVPILNGQLLKNVTLQPGLNKVNHGLGRPYVSYFMSPPRKTTGDADFSTESNFNKDEQLWIDVTSAASVVVDIWIF